MFLSYDSLPDSYVPNNVICPQSTRVKPKFPLVEYNTFGEAIGYGWNYGDTVLLEFTTTGEVVYDEEDKIGEVVEDAETYLEGKMFQLLVFNFRYELVAHCECKAAPIVRILSDSFYPDTLVKGTYKLKLNLIDDDAGTSFTLVDGDDCMIYIK